MTDAETIPRDGGQAPPAAAEERIPGGDQHHPLEPDAVVPAQARTAPPAGVDHAPDAPGEVDPAEELPGDVQGEGDPEAAPFFVEEARRAASEYGSAVASLEYLGIAGPSFAEVVDFIEKSRRYAEKSYTDQEAAALRVEERKLQLEREQREDQARAAERQAKLAKEESAVHLKATAQERLEDRIRFEARLRGMLAVLLVLGSMGGVLYGLFKQMDPESLTQYLAPVTGLAGIVVGYFFGRESKAS